MVQMTKMEHCLIRLVNGITIQSTMTDLKITYDMFKQITNNYIFTNKQLKKTYERSHDVNMESNMFVSWVIHIYF